MTRCAVLDSVRDELFDQLREVLAERLKRHPIVFVQAESFPGDKEIDFAALASYVVDGVGDDDMKWRKCKTCNTCVENR